MRTNCLSRLRAVLWPLLLLSANASGRPQPHQALHAPEATRYDVDRLPPAFHLSRRQAVLDALPDSALAILFSSPVHNRTSDVNFPYRQSSDLYYLTGTTEPESVLLLAPSGFEFRGERISELLLVPPHDPRREIWEGRRLGADQAERDLGLARALPHTLLDSVLAVALAHTRGALFTLPLPPGVDPESTLGRQITTLETQVNLAQSNPRSLDTARLRQVLTGLRAVKTGPEIDLLSKAISITGNALVEAVKSIEPGMFEYEVQAVIEYVFARSGATSPGFPSIVGSGENSVILHYETNRKRMEAGELVVMDVGAETGGYTADITRTAPVGGRFSPEQRALYETVLRAQRVGIQAARAGAPFSAPHQAASRELARGLAELGLISGPSDLRGLARFFMHGASHYLGLDVHDVGPYGLLEPGNVITVEPGLYVSPAPDIDPRWWNIGIRIEDDVLITAQGPVVLSSQIPSDPDEIEALMLLAGIANEPVGSR